MLCGKAEPAGRRAPGRGLRLVRAQVTTQPPAVCSLARWPAEAGRGAARLGYGDM